MRARLWGTRGSLARSGPETLRYGGDTASTLVTASDGTTLVIDAGSGILPLGEALAPDLERVDILLSHLHMDHIQGLGFFPPLYSPDVDVHIWGPVSATLDLRSRLTRYLSPPLFPVRLRDLPAVELHDVAPGSWAVGGLDVVADLVSHPGPTLGFRISEAGGVLTYLSDHEPAIGCRSFPESPEWTSGFALAEGADVLIHDAQYTAAEYDDRVGWGHSTIEHACAFARIAGVGTLVTFHHDPAHSDDALDRLHHEAVGEELSFHLAPGMVGAAFELPAP